LSPILFPCLISLFFVSPPLSPILCSMSHFFVPCLPSSVPCLTSLFHVSLLCSLSPILCSQSYVSVPCLPFYSTRYIGSEDAQHAIKSFPSMLSVRWNCFCACSACDEIRSAYAQHKRNRFRVCPICVWISM
jgi:hypothetical protein